MSRVELLPCRINNVSLDSSAEYSQVRPSALGPLGVDGPQSAALSRMFGPVPPPHVAEAEGVLDKGIEAMEVS